MLILSAMGVSASAMAAAGASDDENGSLAGGTMALEEATKVAGDLWIGPDSAKSDVSAEAGRVYMASDTSVDYYGDNDSWTKRDVGSESEPVPNTYSESISTEEASFGSRPWCDVTEYGAVGDGVTDDSDAIQAAVNDATPNGVLYLPYGHIFRLESTVDIDLGLSDTEIINEDPDNQTQFDIIGNGSIKPVGQIVGIHIHHGSEPRAFVRVEGGGDSSNVKNCVAVKVTDMLGGRFSAQGLHYEGRVLQFLPGGTTAYYVSVPFIHTNRCGQALHAYDLVGFGDIGMGWDHNSVYGPQIDAVDVQIGTWDCSYEDRTQEAMKIGGDAVFANSIEIGKKPELAMVELTGGSKYDLNIYNYNSGVALTNTGKVTDANITINSSGVAGRELDLQAAVETSKIEVTSRDGGSNVVRANAPLSDVTISGTAKNGGYGSTPEKQPCILLRDYDHSNVMIDDFQINSGSYTEDLSVPSASDVRVSNSNINSIAGDVKTLYGVGESSANAETPTASNWRPGDVVDFVDTGDGSGDGVYLLLPNGTWSQIGT